MKKIIKYILIAVPALFLTKCAVELTMSSAGSSPSINSNPTHKMKIHGKFPFEDEVKLDMGLLFITTNSMCDNKNWLAGIQVPHRFMKSFPATVKDGVFESDIYLDSYSSGICGWEAYGVFALLESKKDDLITPYKGVFVNEKQSSEKSLMSSSNVYIGVIAYETFKEQGKILDVECSKKKELQWKDSPNTFRCKYFGEISRSIRNSSNRKANISSSQKKVEINFIDKGWKK